MFKHPNKYSQMTSQIKGAEPAKSLHNVANNYKKRIIPLKILLALNRLTKGVLEGYILILSPIGQWSEPITSDSIHDFLTLSKNSLFTKK